MTNGPVDRDLQINGIRLRVAIWGELSDPSRAVLASSDSRPGRGSLPTNRWQAGWRVIDEYQVSLPGDLP